MKRSMSGERRVMETLIEQGTGVVGDEGLREKVVF